MIHSPRFQSLLDTLTIEQAKEWDATEDKSIYVEVNILDPNNFNRTDRLIYAIEDKFIEILEAADSK